MGENSDKADLTDLLKDKQNSTFLGTGLRREADGTNTPVAVFSAPDRWSDGTKGKPYMLDSTEIQNHLFRLSGRNEGLEDVYKKIKSNIDNRPAMTLLREQLETMEEFDVIEAGKSALDKSIAKGKFDNPNPITDANQFKPEATQHAPSTPKTEAAPQMRPFG